MRVKLVLPKLRERQNGRQNGEANWEAKRGGNMGGKRGGKMDATWGWGEWLQNGPTRAHRTKWTRPPILVFIGIDNIVRNPFDVKICRIRICMVLILALLVSRRGGSSPTLACPMKSPQSMLITGWSQPKQSRVHYMSEALDD